MLIAWELMANWTYDWLSQVLKPLGFYYGTKMIYLYVQGFRGNMWSMDTYKWYEYDRVMDAMI